MDIASGALDASHSTIEATRKWTKMKKCWIPGNSKNYVNNLCIVSLATGGSAA